MVVHPRRSQWVDGPDLLRSAGPRRTAQRYVSEGNDLVMNGRAVKGVAVVLVTWTLVVVALMLLNRSLDLEVFFVLALLGALVLVEQIDTRAVQPRYIRWIKYGIGAGVLLFGWIIANKVLEILAR